MNSTNKKQVKKYDRVMSRVNNQSRSTLKSSSVVTRHHIPTSARLGAKTSSTNFSSCVFSELPIVLNDYAPDTRTDEPVQKTYVVKPRKTIKSLDPAKSPHSSIRKTQELIREPCNIRSQNSAPSVLVQNCHRYNRSLDTHLRECLSSRSHSKLKKLKDEIEAYNKTEKMMKLRSRLYKRCGVVLDEAGQVAEDKAVQVEVPVPDKLSVESSLCRWILCTVNRRLNATTYQTIRVMKLYSKTKTQLSIQN